MAEERFFVAVDGSQLDGDYDISKVRQLVTQHAGRQVLVWNEGLSGWTDPRTLPSFRPGAPSTPANAPVAPTPEPAREPAREPTPARSAGPSNLEREAAARAQQMRDTVQGDVKFFKGLLDPSFDTLITPKIIRTLYIIAMGLVALAALGFLLSGIASAVRGSVIVGLVMILISPIVAVLYLAMVRISFEVVFCLFKIRDAVEKIASKG